MNFLNYLNEIKFGVIEKLLPKEELESPTKMMRISFKLILFAFFIAILPFAGYLTLLDWKVWPWMLPFIVMSIIVFLTRSK